MDRLFRRRNRNAAEEGPRPAAGCASLAACSDPRASCDGHSRRNWKKKSFPRHVVPELPGLRPLGRQVAGGGGSPRSPGPAGGGTR